MTRETPITARLSDEEILRASCRRPDLFKVIISRYESAFSRRAERILGAREEVDDVVVETFTKIYLKADSFHSVEGASFKSWAYKILYHTALTYKRKLKRLGEEMYEEGEFQVDNAADEVSEEMELSYGVKDLIFRVLNKLPRAFSEVLSWHFLEDRPLAEIAAREDLSLSAVKTRLHRAKKEFRKLLTQV